MLLPRLPLRPRFTSASLALVLVFSLFAVVRLTYAQDYNFQGLPSEQGDPAPDSGRSGGDGSNTTNPGSTDTAYTPLSIPIRHNLFPERPNPDNPGYPLPADEGYIAPEERTGNCCVLPKDEGPSSYIPAVLDEDSGEELVPARVECFYNVGAEVEKSSDKIKACKNFTYIIGPNSPNAGIPVVRQGDHFDEKSHVLCNVRCGDLMNTGLCDTNTYQCVESREALNTLYDELELEYLTEKEFQDQVKTYVDMAACDASCKPPVDVKVSVGCSCDMESSLNRCVISAWQDDANGAAPVDIELRSLTVELDWWQEGYTKGTLNGADGEWPMGYIMNEDEYLMDPDDSDSYVEFRAETVVADTDENTTTIEFVPRYGTMTIPAGYWFETEVSVEAIEDPQVSTTEGRIKAHATPERGGDPNLANNQTYDEISTLGDCRKLSVKAECTLTDGNDPDYPNQSFLYHTYTVDTHTYSEDENVEQLYVQFIMDSCLETEEESVKLPAGCEIGTDGDGYPSIDCAFPAYDDYGDLIDESIPDVVSFWVIARPDDYYVEDEDRTCAVGEPVTVTAHIWTTEDDEPDESVTVDDAKIACGRCDVCHTAVDFQGNPSESACSSEYCRWGFAKSGQTGQPVRACVRNEDVCPVYYGACVFEPDPESDDPEDVYQYYYYAGRTEDGTFVSDIAENDDGENQSYFEEEVKPFVEPKRCNADDKNYSESCDFADGEICQNGICIYPCDTDSECNYGDEEDWECRKGRCVDTNISWTQKEYSDFYQDPTDENYDYLQDWKLRCEWGDLEDPDDTRPPKPPSDDDNWDWDLFCDNTYHSADYVQTSYKDDSYTYLTPANYNNLPIYDEQDPNQGVDFGAIFFEGSYSPVELPAGYDDESIAMFAEAVTAFNDDNFPDYTPTDEEFSAQVEEYLTLSPGPSTCEDAKRKGTCCLARPIRSPKQAGCLLVDKDQCPGNFLPAGEDTMETCLLNQELNPNPCAPPDTLGNAAQAGQANAAGNPAIDAPVPPKNDGGWWHDLWDFFGIQ